MTEKETAKAATPAKKIDSDDYRDALTKVKGCAAIVTAMYSQDSGKITYTDEMLELVSEQLFEAARYFDGVLEML